MKIEFEEIPKYPVTLTITLESADDTDTLLALSTFHTWGTRWFWAPRLRMRAKELGERVEAMIKRRGLLL